eukprot:11181072-Lingulodinium_polyedra.AAC.1
MDVEMELPWSRRALYKTATEMPWSRHAHKGNAWHCHGVATRNRNMAMEFPRTCYLPAMEFPCSFANCYDIAR